jgi:hypothetical protein
MKVRANLLLVLLLMVVCGCIKTKTKEITMPDQELKGNRGYIQGTPPALKEETRVKKKKIIEFEVEVPPIFEKSRKRVVEDKDIWGNQGYIYKRGKKMKYIYIGPPEEEEIELEEEKIKEPELEEEEYMDLEERSEVEEGALEIPPDVEVRYVEYRVSEGENLWMIAKKVYGDPTKWILIYEHNKEVIDDPQTIRPGTLLKIPMFEELGSYVK